jgi:hypothetical protein
MDVVHVLVSFPQGPPYKGEWDREDSNRQDTFASSLTSLLHRLIGVGPQTHCLLLSLHSRKIPEGNGPGFQRESLKSFLPALN